MSEQLLSTNSEHINSKENKFIKSSNEMYLGNSTNGSINKQAEILFIKSSRHGYVSRESKENGNYVNEIETDGGFNHRLDKYKDSKAFKKVISHSQNNKIKSNF